MTTAFKMALRTVGQHIFGLLTALFLMVVFIWLFDTPAAWVYTVLAIWAYAGFIYTGGWNFGKKDSRPLPGMRPDVPKAVRAALLAWIPSLVLFAFYLASLTGGPGITSMARNTVPPFIIYNFPLNISISPFLYADAVTNMANLVAGMALKVWLLPGLMLFGGDNLYCFSALLLILPVFTVLGYRVGMTGFSFADKVLPFITYKRKKK